MAARDGIVVVPEEVLCTEKLVRKGILQGVDLVAAHLQHGKF